MTINGYCIIINLKPDEEISVSWKQVIQVTPPSGVALETMPPPPTMWPWRPLWPDPSSSPWVWAWRPSRAIPLKLPPRCGPGNLQGILGYTPPGDLQGMLGYHLQGPVDRQTYVKT